MADSLKPSSPPRWSNDQLLRVLQAFRPLATRTNQLSPDQILAICTEILARPEPNVLVFGLGLDAPFWCAVNPFGRTVFIEDDQRFVELFRGRLARAEIHLVNYTCQRDQWQEEPTFPRNWSPELATTTWDVILVDGPCGYYSHHPGRQVSIWLAAILKRSNTTTIVHDIQRPWEARCISRYLGPAKQRISAAAGDLGIWNS